VKTKDLKNKEMNDATYQLRRKVIESIYKAKKLDPNLPRIEVKITDNHERILGQAYMSSNKIWITERAIKQAKFDVDTIVFHEIVHAVYGVGHDESCPLMKSVHSPLEESERNKLFMKYVKAA
jgi:hypothetical protein